MVKDDKQAAKKRVQGALLARPLTGANALHAERDKAGEGREEAETPFAAFFRAWRQFSPDFLEEREQPGLEKQERLNRCSKQRSQAK